MSIQYTYGKYLQKTVELKEIPMRERKDVGAKYDLYSLTGGLVSVASMIHFMAYFYFNDIQQDYIFF